MLMLAPKAGFISEADYLQAEKLTDIRHEYVHGCVYALAGASLRHNDIALNTAFALRSAALAIPCRVNISDIKVCAAKSKAYFYPDVVVSCEQESADAYYVEQPCLLVEVTSTSTAWTDQHQKVIAYQKLAALQTYLIIAQDRPQVTVYYRDAEGAWDVALYDQLEQSIPLLCPPTELKLADIYAGVDFTQTPTDG